MKDIFYGCAAVLAGLSCIALVQFMLQQTAREETARAELRLRCFSQNVDVTTCDQLRMERFAVAK